MSRINRAPARAGGSRIASAAGGPVDSDVERRIRSAGSGRPLEPELRGRVEPILGRDLAAVRVHTDGNADSATRAIDARAFTLGNDIFSRSGEYSPNSGAGMHLLAHELGHVAQASGGVHRMTIRRFVSDIARGKQGALIESSMAVYASGLADVVRGEAAAPHSAIAAVEPG